MKLTTNRLRKGIQCTEKSYTCHRRFVANFIHKLFLKSFGIKLYQVPVGIPKRFKIRRHFCTFPKLSRILSAYRRLFMITVLFSLFRYYLVNGLPVCEADWQKIVKSNMAAATAAAAAGNGGAPVRKGKVGRPRRSRE